MIVCAECGARNAPDSRFCADCGAFLEWDGEPATGKPPEPQPTEHKPTGHTSGSNGGPPFDDMLAGAGSGAGPGAPELRQPGEARRVRPVPVVDEPRRPAPGEVVCGQCGAGNDRSRRFCRSCGARLAEVAPAARAPWWRRLLARLRGRRYDAGTRRRVAKPRGHARTVLLTAAVLAVILALVALLPARPLVNRIALALSDRLSGQAPLTPVRERASSAAPGAPASRVADGATNRYWAPAGRAMGAWVEVDFAQPVRLLSVIVSPGVSSDKQRFLTQGRPHGLTVTVTPRSGKATTTTIAVRDEPGGQSFPVKVSDVVRVRLTITSTYGMPPGHLCGIGELEFFIRG